MPSKKENETDLMKAMMDAIGKNLGPMGVNRVSFCDSKGDEEWGFDIKKSKNSKSKSKKPKKK